MLPDAKPVTQPFGVFDLLRELTAQHPWMVNDAFMSVRLSARDYEIIWFPKNRAQVAAIIRAVRGRWQKNDPAVGGYNAAYATWRQRRDGVTYMIVVDRLEVCTRVEVGRRTVTVDVPATPAHTETREVIDYEWRCGPVLEAKAPAKATA